MATPFVIGPQNMRPGRASDVARIQKLERQYAELLKRVEELEAKRGPGRPKKEAA